MTDRTDLLLPLQTNLHRRTTIKALALGSLAVFAGAAFGTSALGDTDALTLQAGWRWCSKCEGMFYAVATAGMGVCPAGGAHIDAGSGHYHERIGGDIAGVQQGGWSWCAKCEGFFYSRASLGAGGMGHCPAGGTHIKTGSGAYAAIIGEDAPRQQGGWRWCNKCMGMFYARASAGKGVCPADHKPHSDSGSGHYASIFF